jgi:hypothetical protein
MALTPIETDKPVTAEKFHPLNMSFANTTKRTGPKTAGPVRLGKSLLVIDGGRSFEKCRLRRS